MPLSPAAAVHSLPPPPPPTRAKWLHQLLPGGDRPGPATGGQSRAAAGGKSHSLLPVWAPRLPERLSLTESHGPVGAGAREGQKVPEASAAAVLLRLLKTLDLREAVTAESRAQVTPRGLSRLWDSASVGPWQPSGFLRPQFTHLWHVSGGRGVGTQRN